MNDIASSHTHTHTPTPPPGAHSDVHESIMLLKCVIIIGFIQYVYMEYIGNCYGVNTIGIYVHIMLMASGHHGPPIACRCYCNGSVSK